MVSNEAYRSARANAAAHLQVQLSPLNRRAGQETVAGKIARIFSDRTGTLALWQAITFPQPFYTHRQPDAGPSAEAW